MKTLLVAHRGAEPAPENTLSAFKLAKIKRFKVIECDVQLSSDGDLFVIHDAEVDRTTDGHGWVSQLTSAQLMKLHINPDEHIPLLREVMELVVKTYRLKLIIEIKADTSEHAIEVAHALSTHLSTLPSKYLHRIEVHSFWYKAIKVFKITAPNIVTAVVVNGGFEANEVIEIAREANANGVSIGYEYVSMEVVRACHKHHLFVDTWAVPDQRVMRRLQPFGLKAILKNLRSTPRPIASSSIESR